MKPPPRDITRSFIPQCRSVERNDNNNNNNNSGHWTTTPSPVVEIHFAFRKSQPAICRIHSIAEMWQRLWQGFLKQKWNYILRFIIVVERSSFVVSHSFPPDLLLSSSSTKCWLCTVSNRPLTRPLLNQLTGVIQAWKYHFLKYQHLHEAQVVSIFETLRSTSRWFIIVNSCNKFNNPTNVMCNSCITHTE